MTFLTSSFVVLVIILHIKWVHTQEERSCTLDGTCDGPPCHDVLKYCPVWAERGECRNHPGFMFRQCANSCKACGPCIDEVKECRGWAETGECDKNPRYMLTSCRRSCAACASPSMEWNFGIEQVVDDEQHSEAIHKALDDMRLYFQSNWDDPNTDIKTHILLDNCKNNHEQCTFWKVLGECDANPGYMKLTCAAACHTCDLLDFETRCPLDPLAVNAWGPGDLHNFFINITTLEEFQNYKPVVHSRPDDVGDHTPDNTSTAPFQIGPWVVTLDSFVTEEEADRLIEFGSELGYERSSGVGQVQFDGSVQRHFSDHRTSANAWCEGVCYNDPLAVRVMKRIEQITYIPQNNSEPLQLLKYEVGQFYRAHHDYISHHADRQAGPRILTVFLYLNEVEGGGGTNFPLLDITIMPKKGRALIWSSVNDDAPFEKDPRTQHQALPVEAGIKYGANAWIHMRDAITPLEANCM